MQTPEQGLPLLWGFYRGKATSITQSSEVVCPKQAVAEPTSYDSVVPVPRVQIIAVSVLLWCPSAMPVLWQCLN